MKPYSKEYIGYITNLEPLQKLLIYNSYMVIQLKLKHDITIFIKPKRVVKERLWSDINIVGFEDWCSTDNIKNSGHGNDFEGNGWAQKVTTTMSGIYDWYWRFNNHFDERPTI